MTLPDTASPPEAPIDLISSEAQLITGALQNAILKSENFSSIATDAKGVIQLFNVGAERMLGYKASEVMNRITPADISDPEEVIARALALSIELGTQITPGFEALVFKASRGIEDIYELTYIRKDGSRFPAVVSVTALRDDQGAIIGYLLNGTDNTARMQVEEERSKLDQSLRDQQFYTRSLIESNIDALMTTDPSGVITDVNNQMEALTGLSRDELIGAFFKNYFTDPTRAEEGIRRVLSEGKVTDYELTAQNGKDGIDLARRCVPDMILMDINLPGISGIDAMRILNQNPVTAHIPIVALSANAMPMDVATGLSAGFFKYLTKPINVIALMETHNFTLEFAANRDGSPLPAPAVKPLEAVI